MSSLKFYLLRCRSNKFSSNFYGTRQYLLGPTSSSYDFNSTCYWTCPWRISSRRYFECWKIISCMSASQHDQGADHLCYSSISTSSGTMRKRESLFNSQLTQPEAIVSTSIAVKLYLLGHMVQIFRSLKDARATPKSTSLVSFIRWVLSHMMRALPMRILEVTYGSR